MRGLLLRILQYYEVSNKENKQNEKKDKEKDRKGVRDMGIPIIIL